MVRAATMMSCGRPLMQEQHLCASFGGWGARSSSCLVSSLPQEHCQRASSQELECNLLSVAILNFDGARNTHDCREKGYSDVLYLDAIENKYVEEVSLQYLHCKGQSDLNP